MIVTPELFWTNPRGLTFTRRGCYGLCRDINQRSLPTPLHSFLVSVSVFMALSTVFHSIHSPDKLSAFSLSSCGLISALLILSTICLFMKVSHSPDVILCGWLGLKHQLTTRPKFHLAFTNRKQVTTPAQHRQWRESACKWLERNKFLTQWYTWLCKEVGFCPVFKYCLWRPH